MWYRVFSPTVAAVSPVALVEHLRVCGQLVVPHFRGDDLGWTAGELHFTTVGGGLETGVTMTTGTPVMIARYLTKEDELRADLNAYAAELETLTYSPNNVPLMERVIRTQQLMTLRRPIDAASDSAAESLCLLASQFFAAQSGGFYQVDGAGWYEADGTELIREY